MSEFLKRLKKARPSSESDRRWIYVPYDQLTSDWGPLSDAEPKDVGIVLVESAEKGSRRPYHKQKLALLLANMRHFALEQADRGVAVRYVTTDGATGDALRDVAEDVGSLVCQKPAEYELRAELEPLADDGLIELVEHEGWLTTSEQFEESQKKRPWRMDAFYRQVRNDSGILMEDDSPVGGKYSFDAENRESWSGDPAAPELPTFDPDEPIRAEVCELVRTKFSKHPGELEPKYVPATLDDAERQWKWALDECLQNFGPYQDAMSDQSSNLFHTRISGLIHLGRLSARRVIADVEKRSSLPLASREGFIRQILGWREFMRHVHEATDGFRKIPERRVSVRDEPGDGGFESWADEAWEPIGELPEALDGGATATTLGRGAGVPPAFWGEKSGLRCLDISVEDVWREGYGHHIARLMVLANLATLLDISARDLADWFWCAYTDAYDWVVEPNVLGMGTYGVGALMTTKPYISGAAYIDRMSDYCKDCTFHPKKTCPITRLYWAFLERHKDLLDSNPRLRMPYATLKKRDSAKKKEDEKIFEKCRDRLRRGSALSPEDFEG